MKVKYYCTSCLEKGRLHEIDIDKNHTGGGLYSCKVCHGAVKVVMEKKVLFCIGIKEGERPEDVAESIASLVSLPTTKIKTDRQNCQLEVTLPFAIEAFVQMIKSDPGVQSVEQLSP